MSSKQMLIPMLGFEFHDTENTIAHDVEAANFIPEVWSNKVLKAVFSKSALISSVNRNYEDEVASSGDIVNVPVNGTLTAASKVANTAVTWQNPTADVKYVTLSEHTVVPFIVEDVAKAMSKPDVIGGYINDAADVIVNDVEAYLASVIQAGATYDVTYDNTSDATRLSSLLEARTNIRVTNKCPKDQPLFLVVHDLADLLQCDYYINNDYTSKKVADADDGRIADFQVKESSECTTLSGLYQWYGFAKDSVSLVTRPMPAAGGGAQSSNVQSNGLSIRTTMQYDIDYVALKILVDILYGATVLRPEWANLIQTDIS